MNEPELTSVQRAYDAAVAEDGYPTERAKQLLASHPNLIREMYDAAHWLTDSIDDDDVSLADVFLAAFTAALIWIDDNPRPDD